MSVAGEGDVVIAEALAEVVRDGGRALTSEPRRVQAMLNDVLGAQARSHRAEVDAVVVAVEESVPEGLLARSFDQAGAVDRLGDRGLDTTMAQFACAVWQYALGMSADEVVSTGESVVTDPSIVSGVPLPVMPVASGLPGPERVSEPVGQHKSRSPRRRVVMVTAVGATAVLALLAGATVAYIINRPPTTTTIEDAALGDVDVLAVAERLDLSDPDGPLPTIDDHDRSSGYIPGAAYQLTAKAAGVVNYVTRSYGTDVNEDDRSDMTVVAEIDPSSAPPDARFGVLCRDDGNNFYAFAVGTDGAYSIAKVEHGEATFLTGDGAWVTSDKLDDLPDPAAIEARCVSDELSLFVEGELIDQVTDDALTGGDGAGVFVASSETADATITVERFDVTGYYDRSQVDDEEALTWEQFADSGSTELQQCYLVDAEHMGIEPTPRFVTVCEGIVFAQFDSASGAIDAFDQVVSDKGVKLQTVAGIPDCRSRSNVRQKSDGVDPGVDPQTRPDVACITDSDSTALFWTNGTVLGAVRADPEAPDFDPEVFSGYGKDWWPFTVGDAPG